MTCDLQAGHDGSHINAAAGQQWYDRSMDYGPGAYYSVEPGDAGWRHERADCPQVHRFRRTHDACTRCLTAERDELRAAVECCPRCTDAISTYQERSDAT